MTHHETTTHERTKGAGLARGPALVLGAILAVFGLILFIHAGDSASMSTSGFTDGDPVADKFLGFEANAWTAWITTAAGVLLLFGAAQHLLAKAMSLIVALGLGACAVLGAVEGDVLGLAASNVPTWIGWGIAAVLLFFNLFAPRIDHDRDHVDHDRHSRRRFGRRRDAVDRDAAVTDHRHGEAETRPLGTSTTSGETRSSEEVRRGS
jgi:hypothetical protein